MTRHLNPHELTDLNARFEGAAPETIIAWAAERFMPALAATSSFQTQSVALLHLISRVRPDLPVIFLDTGYHFPETLQTRDWFADSFPNPLVTLHPKESPAEQTTREGRELWRYPDDYKRCCELRKIVPLVEYVDGRFEAVLLGIHRADGGRVPFSYCKRTQGHGYADQAGGSSQGPNILNLPSGVGQLRTLMDLQSEMAQTLDMVRLSKLDMESRLVATYKLGEIAAFILIIQSMGREAKSLLEQVQELVRSHSSSPILH